ncbi:hypothetical protein Scep_002036 [Stephania cephalantha]|uniref:Uncharacterized protein n=1 Tax=Stephania cephalantha TaxID=152367 RepID=A0AAP0LBY3_9MAGN
MENATTFRKDDRDAAGSRFARADELHTSHDQQLQEILRLLRAHVTLSSSAALVGPAVVEETHVQAEIVLPTHETLHEEMLSALTDTGVRVTAKARQSREFSDVFTVVRIAEQQRFMTSWPHQII